MSSKESKGCLYAIMAIVLMLFCLVGMGWIMAYGEQVDKFLVW